MNKTLKRILFFVFSFLALVLASIVVYTRRNFAFVSNNPIAQILFHCIVQIDGADPTFIRGIAIRCVLIPFVGALLATLFIYGDLKILSGLNKIRLYSILKRYGLILSVIAFIGSFLFCANELKLSEYIKSVSSTSTLYEDEYVDPSTVDFVFPEKKRNLIYIMLESVEVSDYSKNEGGAFDDNYIPELYQLAQDNITFNNNRGYEVAPNTGWTIASMVAQSSGIPLTIPIGENDFVTSNKFLPGAYSLGEILEKEGYTNELLIGSEAVFSGRKYYYEKHGDYVIHDFNYFVENDLFDYDTRVWWGIIDMYLFDFAKQDLMELSKNDEPFNLTLLTVDTHHTDGWVCDLCEDKFDEQLANVYACSSRQVNNFIEWIKQQDFYENTTIIVAGDHCSMSTGFANLMGDHDRKVYYTIINPAKGLEDKQDRQFCTFDLYPTSLASLGVKFEGDRLGLGTNLFSDEKTLMEKYGKDEFFNRVKEYSKYYVNHILYGIE